MNIIGTIAVDHIENVAIATIDGTMNMWEASHFSFLHIFLFII